MDQCATSVRNHCLSPARASVAINVPLGPATYSRMFPDLPSFEAMSNSCTRSAADRLT